MSTGEGRHPRVELVRLSANTYSLDIIKKAAYRFLDRFASDFRIEGSEVLCTLTFARPTTTESAELAVAEFKSEVLDQDLRQKIAQESLAYRNAILALAFAPSKLQDHE
jgi:His-Xaa-Ser system protein HxsD